MKVHFEGNSFRCNITHIDSNRHKTSDNKMFKSALHGKTVKHIRQLTEWEFRKANIRTM